MPQPLRLGLIGAGRWGRNYIATIAAIEGVRLARIASRNPESRALAPGDCEVLSEWSELLDRRAIDAAIIATPPALHAEMVRTAVARGLPALVEKPLTLDAGEARGLRDFVAAHRGLVMVGHTHLFNPAWRSLKDAAARYGRIRAIASQAGNTGPFRTDAPVLWDWGAHDVAMCLDLLGAPPETVEARCVEQRETPEGRGEVLELKATFPDAVLAVLRFGNVLPRTRRFMVYLEGALLVYDDLAEHKAVVHPPMQAHAEPRGPGEPLAYRREAPLACAVAEFAACVRESSRSLRHLELGVAVVEVLERCAPGLAGAAVAR